MYIHILYHNPSLFPYTTLFRSLAGVLDLTTTELADDLVGGVLSAGPHRLEAAGAAGIPQVVSLEIGRASCRERVESPVGAGPLNRDGTGGAAVESAVRRQTESDIPCGQSTE